MESATYASQEARNDHRGSVAKIREGRRESGENYVAHQRSARQLTRTPVKDGPCSARRQRRPSKTDVTTIMPAKRITAEEEKEPLSPSLAAMDCEASPTISPMSLRVVAEQEAPVEGRRPPPVDTGGESLALTDTSSTDHVLSPLGSPNDAGLAMAAAGRLAKRRSKQHCKHYALCFLSCCLAAAALVVLRLKWAEGPGPGPARLNSPSSPPSPHSMVRRLAALRTSPARTAQGEHGTAFATAPLGRTMKAQTKR